MKHILVETKDFVQTLTLNRPDVRNAFNEEMIQEMTQAFQDVAHAKDVRVLIIQGAGESFCAGGDLNWMKSMVDFNEEENRQDSEKLYEMYEALRTLDLPVVCFVHGHAMGGALGLMAASDIVFAVDGTQFCFSEVRLGLAPAVISAFVKNKIHPADMHRYFLTAEVFDSSQASDMGLVQDYGSKEEMREVVEKVVKKLSNNGPQAVRATKKMMGELHTTKDLKALTTQVIARLRVSEEGQEGLKAFFEKRKPDWIGGSRG